MDTPKLTKDRFHYAWLILIGCCFLMAGAAGLLLGCAGVFFPPVCSELGFGVGELLIFFTILQIATMIMMPLVGKLLPKLNIRILLSVCFIVCNASVALMSQFTALWQWYIAGALMGLAGAFVFLVPATILINNWFQQKAGFALGFAMAFSGVAGVIFNPIIAYFITTFGWRTAYLMVAGISALLVLPFTLFVFRFQPEDMGLKPYGYEESTTEPPAAATALPGVPADKAIKSLSFVMMFLLAGFIALPTGFNMHMPTFADSIGMTTAFGASMVSAIMIGNVSSKLLIGWMNDIIGIFKVTLISVMIAAAVFIGLVFFQHSPAILLALCVFLGITNGMTSVGIPLLVRSLFGSRDYTAIFSYINIGLCLVNAFGVTIIGFMYDHGGSYNPTFILGVVVCALTVLLLVLAFAGKRKLVWEDQDHPTSSVVG